MPEMNTVRGTVARAREEGLPVTEYALRLWVRQGRIPVRKAGRVLLLYWPNVKKFLTCADGGDIPQL